MFKVHKKKLVLFINNKYKIYSAKPSDFAYKLVIGKGSFGKVLLATHKKENKVYAVKVLQKRSITRRNEVFDNYLYK